MDGIKKGGGGGEREKEKVKKEGGEIVIGLLVAGLMNEKESYEGAMDRYVDGWNKEREGRKGKGKGESKERVWGDCDRIDDDRFDEWKGGVKKRRGGRERENKRRKEMNGWIED